MPIWCGIVFVIANTINFSKKELVDGTDVLRTRIGFSIFAFLPVFLIATIAEPCADVIAYLQRFDMASTSLHSINLKENGWGFSLLTVIIKRLFNNNHLVFRLIIGLVHSVPIIFIFRKYSENYLLSLFVFVSSATYLSWMMNGLRQFMAVTIILLSIPFLMKKKYLKVCLIVLLATAIHQTAIIMLPILLIVQGKIFNRYTMLFIIVSITAMSLFSLNSELFESAISGTDYASGYEYVKLTDDGINPIRVLINAIPIIFAFLGREKLKAENNKFCNISINMSMITLGMSLVAMVTSGIYVGRLIIYTQLFNFIILPKLINTVFEKKSKHLIVLAMILLYLIYYKYALGNYFYYDLDIFGGLK